MPHPSHPATIYQARSPAHGAGQLSHGGSAALSDRRGTPPVSAHHVPRSSGTRKSPPAAHVVEQQLTQAGRAPVPARLRPSQPRVAPPRDLPQNKHRGR
ncbi:hypothetical protein NDU88_006177 [Pleurodeles waltl]|uniref:Uncharacterized protein n=1 Tax=Pleurodeles waltl TaxID=8319 RepID=A0AAV7MYT5_PLEWA|nr:hypothetical protein NDU88_006177 [Pleurodeles waltl]